MARRVKELRDLEIDEISLVDKGANQHARTVIAKRHDEEDTMSKYFDQGGNPVDVDSLELGDVVFDSEGEAFEVSLEDEEIEQPELELVGKAHSNPFERQPEYTASVEDIREELSKAMTDDDRDEVISKAFDRLGEYETIAKAAQESAEAERQMRLDREYTEIAKSYNVGISPEDLGPVLKRCAESLDHEDCVVLAKALDSATAAGDLFEEIGKAGGADNSDVFRNVEAHIDSVVAKGAESLSRADMISKVFEDNPEEYDEWLREQSNR